MPTPVQLAELACRAGGYVFDGMTENNEYPAAGTVELDPHTLAMFAKLVAEECAQIAETAPDLLQDSTFDGVARAIRSRFGG